MRFLIAPDAFKGTLTAAQAAEAIAAGIHHIIPTAEIETLPLADGGEGTLDVLISHVSHEDIAISIEQYVIYTDNDGVVVALIESARHLGLTRPDMQALDVFGRGSGALGDCIRERLDAGIRRFVIGLGGSATNDAGLGLLAALGLRAFDGQGRMVSPDLRGLLSTRSIDISGMDARFADCCFTVLCDVDAPLCGASGATVTFGPQKGLSADDLEPVDQAMERFAHLAETAFGHSVNKLPGSGAAGGLGFAFALLGGALVSGADYVIEKAGLAERLKGVDWVVTGEGRSDAQTLAGKLPVKVATLARAAGVRMALISGSVDRTTMPELEKRFDRIISAQPDGIPDDPALKQAKSLLVDAAMEFGRIIG